MAMVLELVGIEFFNNTNPESWILSFESSHLFYEMKLLIKNYLYGEIYQVRQILTNSNLIIKSIFKCKRPIGSIRNEVKIMKALGKSKHLVSFIECFENEDKHFHVYENHTGISLKHFVKKIKFANKEYQLKLILLLFFNILKGVEYLNSFGIVHRSLCPDNIVIDELGNPRIWNFEYASIESKYKIHIFEKIILSEFDSPELISNPKTSSKKMDVYSCGKILEWMINHFDLMDFIKLTQVNILLVEMLNKEKEFRISLNESLSKDCFNFIKYSSHCQMNVNDMMIILNNTNKIITNIPNKAFDLNNFFSFGPDDAYVKQFPKNDKLNYLNNNLFISNSKETFELEKAKRRTIQIDSTNNTNKENKAIKKNLEYVFEKEEIDEIKHNLILNYLNNCGFPKDYINQISQMSSFENFTHIEACYKIMFNQFNP